MTPPEFDTRERYDASMVDKGLLETKLLFGSRVNGSERRDAPFPKVARRDLPTNNHSKSALTPFLHQSPLERV
jgi:hypothetical protein